MGSVWYIDMSCLSDVQLFHAKGIICQWSWPNGISGIMTSERLHHCKMVYWRARSLHALYGTHLMSAMLVWREFLNPRNFSRVSSVCYIWKEYNEFGLEKSLLCLWGCSFLFPSQVRPLWLNLWRILWGPLFCCPLPNACPPSGPALIKSRPSSVEPSTLWGTTSQRNKSSRRAWRRPSSLTGRNSWDCAGVVKFSWYMGMQCFAFPHSCEDSPPNHQPISHLSEPTSFICP